MSILKLMEVLFTSKFAIHSLSSLSKGVKFITYSAYR